MNTASEQFNVWTGCIVTVHVRMYCMYVIIHVT